MSRSAGRLFAIGRFAEIFLRIQFGLRVINKAMLNAQLAKIHIDDMLSLGLRFRF